MRQSLARRYGLHHAEVEEMGVGQGQTARFRIRIGDDQFIAKSLTLESAQELYFESALLDHLSRATVTTQTILRTLDGDVSTIWNERALVVYRWMDGAIQWPTSPANAVRLGESVAAMHLASDELPLTGRERTYDLERLIERPMQLIEPFAASTAQFLRLSSAVDRLRGRLAMVPTTPSAFGPIHGDLHQGNCAFEEDGKLAIFDFALCGVGYRLYDLTGYLWPMRDRTIEEPAMRDCCLGFLDGYRLVRPLSASEESAISAFVHVRTLWETGDWLDTGTGANQPRDVVTAINHMIDQFNGASL